MCIDTIDSYKNDHTRLQLCFVFFITLSIICSGGRATEIWPPGWRTGDILVPEVLATGQKEEIANQTCFLNASGHDRCTSTRALQIAAAIPQVAKKPSKKAPKKNLKAKLVPSRVLTLSSFGTISSHLSQEVSSLQALNTWLQLRPVIRLRALFSYNKSQHILFDSARVSGLTVV